MTTSKRVPKACPRCGTRADTVATLAAVAARVLSCPECGYEWEEAGAHEALDTLRAQTQRFRPGGPQAWR